MKNKYFVFYSLVILITFFQTVPAFAAQVWVVLARTNSAYSSLLSGFEDNAQFHYSVIRLEDKNIYSQTGYAALKPRDSDAVLVVGSEAWLACQNFKNQVPLAYSMILDPRIVQNNTIPGISMNISVNRQFEGLRALFPERKRIGVIYQPLYSSQTIEEARLLSQKYGFSLYPIAIQEKSEIPQALSKFTKDTVDIIWMIVDPVVSNPISIQKHIIHAKIEQLPLVGLSIHHVQTGALLAFSVDYQALGKQTAFYMQKFIKQPGQLKPEDPKQVTIYINRSIQKELGIVVHHISEVKWIE